MQAFAEHPRENKTRVDLSIVNKNNAKTPIKIEFKFQFSGDFKNLADCKSSTKSGTYRHAP